MTSEDYTQPSDGIAIPMHRGEKVGHPTMREARVHELIMHERFRGLCFKPHHGIWSIDHATCNEDNRDEPGTIGRLSSGDLDNLLTTWENLVDGWEGDKWDGIG